VRKQHRKDSLETVDSVHVVSGRDLEAGCHVGEVNLALGLGIGAGSLGCRGVGVLAPTLFTGCADIGRASLLEWLALECDGGDSATVARSDRVAQTEDDQLTRG
jgi:hypothetical protein